MYVCVVVILALLCMCVSHCPEGWRWRYSSWGEEASKLTFEPLLFLAPPVWWWVGGGLNEVITAGSRGDVAYIGGDGVPSEDEETFPKRWWVGHLQQVTSQHLESK